MTTAFTAQIKRSGNRQHRIAVIDGPNMSNLGARSKKVYGKIGSLDELKAYVADYGRQLGVEVECFSSNHQGDILGQATDETVESERQGTS